MSALTIIPAAYESRCGGCDNTIRVDDDIVNVDGEWVHANCAEEMGYEVEDA